MADYGLWRDVISKALSIDGNWMTSDYRKPEAHKDALEESNNGRAGITSREIYV